MKLFSLANEEQIFVKKEDPEGTLVYPTAAEAVLITAASAIGAEIEFIDDEQLRDSRSRLSAIKGRTHPGEWSMNTYLKPSGTVGIPPETDVLFECLMGKKSTPGNVVYELDSSINLPSFSLWVKKGHAIFAMEGCTVNTAEFTISGSEIVSVAWGGNFMQWYKGGTAYAAGAVAPGASTVTVDDATRFAGENKVKIILDAAAAVPDDNGGLGYLITDINYGTNVITFSPVAVTGCANGAAIRGWIPSSQSTLGDPIHGKITTVEIDDVPATLLSASISMVNNIKYYEDEMNAQWYATTYGTTGWREVNAALSLYFRKPTTAYFYRSEYQIQDKLEIYVGTVAGKKVEFLMPKIEYRTPVLSGDEEVLMEIPIIAVASATLDDEFKITFM